MGLEKDEREEYYSKYIIYAIVFSQYNSASGDHTMTKDYVIYNSINSVENSEKSIKYYSFLKKY